MNSVSELIAVEVSIAIRDSQKRELIPDLEIGPIPIEIPQNSKHGDFACSLPLKLAGQMKMNPIEIAKIISDAISVEGPVGYVEPVLPGFINIFVNQTWILNQIDKLYRDPKDYFFQDIGDGELVQIEYVSANPTGRLHVAHARGAVLGSTLARLMTSVGYTVHQEYYLNDAGSQIDKFNASLDVRYRQLFGEQIELPEDSYPGQDIIDVSMEIRNTASWLNMLAEGTAEADSEIGS